MAAPSESEILALQNATTYTHNLDIWEGKYAKDSEGTVTADSPTIYSLIDYGTIAASFSGHDVDYRIKLDEAFNQDVSISVKLEEAGGASVLYEGTLSSGETSVFLSSLDTDYSPSTLESREDSTDQFVMTISEMPVGTKNVTLEVVAASTFGEAGDETIVTSTSTEVRQGAWRNISVLSVYDSSDVDSLIAAAQVRTIYKYNDGYDVAMVDAKDMGDDELGFILGGYSDSNRQRCIQILDISASNESELADKLRADSEEENDDLSVTEYTITDRTSEESAGYQAWVDIVSEDVPEFIHVTSNKTSELTSDQEATGKQLRYDVISRYYDLYDSELLLNLSRAFDIGYYDTRFNNVMASGANFASIDAGFVDMIEDRGLSIKQYIDYIIAENDEIDITTSSLSDAQNDYSYSATVAGDGGIGNYTFSASGLPDGLSISDSGAISGTPYDTVTDYDVDFTVEDFVGNSTTETVTLTLTENDKTDFLAFDITDGTSSIATGAATIDETAHTITIEVASGTNLGDGVTPEFTLDYGATVGTITSGTEYSGFTDGTATTVTVTAEDGSTTQDWDITVNVAA